MTPLLTAQWRNLLMLNYEVDPALLRPFVPAGTELDEWNGRSFVSIVGFRFLQARWLGWRMPFHVNFDEVNLRFYVRHKSHEGWRRGVVFLKEIAPRPAVALVARLVYNENYISLPMRSSIDLPTDSSGWKGSVGYSWKWSGQWIEASARIAGEPMLPQPESEVEFITEHYWAYTAQRDGSTRQYQVEHPPWRVWSGDTFRFEGDVQKLYGPDFARALSCSPSSVIVADGSEVLVHRGNRIRFDHRSRHRPSFGAASSIEEDSFCRLAQEPLSIFR